MTDKFNFLAGDGQGDGHTGKVPVTDKVSFWQGRAAHTFLEWRTVKQWPRSWLNNAPRTTANVLLAAKLCPSVPIESNI